MAITLSTGASIAVAKTYTTAVTTSAVSNASEAVCTTSSAHSITVGDYVEISSGWGLLDKRVVRAKTGTTGSTLVLEGVDTTDTSKYTSGTGIGSVRKISAWTQLSQVKSISASGGSQNFANITGLADVVERQIPTTKSAVSMTCDCFDDPTLAWYSDVSAADSARTPYGLLMAFPNGSKLAANAYWSLQKVPTMASNEALMSQITMAYAAEPVRYAS
jgi:hypothetical protein